METSKDFYAIVVKSGQFYKCARNDDFCNCPSDAVECYLFAKYTHTFKGPSNWTDWYHITIVDKKGNPSTYRIGNFEAILIGEDIGYTNFFGRDITIHDISSGKYYKYNPSFRSGNFFSKKSGFPMGITS